MKTRAESYGKSGDYSVENGGKSGRGIKVHLTLLNVVLTNQAWAKRDFDPFLSFLNFAIFFQKNGLVSRGCRFFFFYRLFKTRVSSFSFWTGLKRCFIWFFFFWWTICFNYNRECLEKSERRISLNEEWMKKMLN